MPQVTLVNSLWDDCGHRVHELLRRVASTPSTSLSRATCATCAHNGARAVGSRIIKCADQHVGPRVDPSAGAPLRAPAASSPGDYPSLRGAGAAALAPQRRAAPTAFPPKKSLKKLKNRQKKTITWGNSWGEGKVF